MAKRDQGRPSGMGSRDYTDADDIAQRNAREGQRESQQAGSRRQSGSQHGRSDRDQNRQQQSGNQRSRNSESNRNNRGSSRQNER